MIHKVTHPLLIFAAFALAACGFPRPDDVTGPGTCDDCRLLAVEPQLAAHGATITLEGTFSSSVIVDFPGGASATAQVLGLHRADVVVPDAATTGMLTVEGVPGAVAFRATAWALGVGPVQTDYEQTDGARQMPRLAVARRAPASAVIGPYMYVMGGATGGAAAASSDAVERAVVNADGTLGAFAPVPGVALATARLSATSAVIGDWLYVVGGFSNRALSSIERAPIHPDGSVGSFAIVTDTALNIARDTQMMAVAGHSLYVLGGANEAGTLDSVERAPINVDGTLGPFEVLPQRLITPRDNAACAVVGRSLVISGGGNPGALASVEVAAIDGDGNLGEFSVSSTQSLAAPRFGHRMHQIGDWLYVIGGSEGSEAIERAPIASDGTPGPFAPVPGLALPSTRYKAATEIAGDHLYILGGDTGAGPVASVERAAVNIGAVLRAFSELPTVQLTGPHVDGAGVVLGNSAYVIGGNGDGSVVGTIERATVTADGQLDGFELVHSAALTRARAGLALAVVGAYVYAIGGFDGTGDLNIVERATIAADGTLGSFSPVEGVALVTPRARPVVVVLGEAIYVIGGSDGSYLNTVERAPIDNTGAIGAFSTVSGLTLVTPRYAAGAVVTDDTLSIVGGDASGDLSSIEVVDLNPLGAFSQTSNLSSPRSRFAAPMVGNRAYFIGGSSPSEFRVVNSTGLDSSGGSDLNVTVDVPRVGHVGLVAGHHVYLIGGTSARGGLLLNSVEAADLGRQ